MARPLESRRTVSWSIFEMFHVEMRLSLEVGGNALLGGAAGRFLLGCCSSSWSDGAALKIFPWYEGGERAQLQGPLVKKSTPCRKHIISALPQTASLASWNRTLDAFV